METKDNETKDSNGNVSPSKESRVPHHSPSAASLTEDSDKLEAWLKGGGGGAASMMSNATTIESSSAAAAASSSSVSTIPMSNTTSAAETTRPAPAPTQSETTTTTTIPSETKQQQQQPKPSPHPHPSPLPPRAPLAPDARVLSDDRTTEASNETTNTTSSTLSPNTRPPTGVLKNADRSSPTVFRRKVESTSAPGAATGGGGGATVGEGNLSSEDFASLMRGSAPPPLPFLPAQHQRNVSWSDQQHLPGNQPSLVQQRAPVMTTPTLDPLRSLSDFSLLDDSNGPTSPNSNAPSALTSGSRHTTASSMDSLQGANIVNLDTILKVNPLETEAETLILKAIETQDAVNRSPRARANTGNSNLFPNVPAEAINIFTTPPVIATENAANQDQLPNGGLNNHNGRPPPYSRDHSRRTTQSSHSPPHSEHETRRVGAGGRTASPKPQKRVMPEPSHRRNQTMEQTLAGLSQALADMNRSSTHGSSVEDPLVELSSQGVNPPTAASSGETLARNANVLFGGRQKTGGTPMMGPPLGGALGRQKTEGRVAGEGSSAAAVTARPKKAAQNWGKLRNIVKATGGLPKHPPITTADEDPSNSSTSLKSAEIPIPGSVHIHRPTDSSGRVSDFCDRIEEMGEEEEDIENGEGLPHKAFQEGAAGPEKSGGEKEDEARMSRKQRRRRRAFKKSTHVVAQSGFLRDFRIFVNQRRASFITYLWFLLFVEVPAIIVAFVLFYAFDNPPTGRVDRASSANDILVRENTGNPINPLEASASWWIIFICVRQALTFSLAQLLEVIIIDFFCLSSRIFVKLFGNLVTLLIVQSRGWPFLVLMWGLLDFGLLYGSSRFVQHWLFWQDFAGIFNDSNPGGSVTSNIWYTRVLTIAVSVSAVVAVKRLWLGLYLGKKTFQNYAEDLAKVVQKLVVLADVAALARTFLVESLEDDQSRRQLSVSRFGMSREEFDVMIRSSAQAPDEESFSHLDPDTSLHGGRLVDPSDVDADGDLSHLQRQRIAELLGTWEEPEESMAIEDEISIGGILQFRHSLSFLEGRYMFSIAFGDVSNRDQTIVSSQEVYRRLLLRTPDRDVLSFDVLALAALRSNGTLSQEKLKSLIKLLRPDRDGNLQLLDFVKSVDAVYKEARLLRASIRNSEKIDRAFENAINIIFYTVVVCIILSQLGFNPVALFLSLSSIILAFAFMIGSASSKMFEGWLFILLRRPYDIGDRIHISNPESDTNPNGSAGWIVMDVNLFSTTAVFATTGERATLSNGSLANSRVINMARSPNAVVYIYLKFATGVAYERVQIFEKALTQFVKARPREWVALLGFRATQVMADQGFIEYVAVLKHREAWQNVVTILVSKAQVASFCLELSKKLNMRYRSPPLPVDLAMVKSNRGSFDASDQSTTEMERASLDDSARIQELVTLFESKKDK